MRKYSPAYLRYQKLSKMAVSTKHKWFSDHFSGVSVKRYRGKMAYYLRSSDCIETRKNYREVNIIKLPRAERVKNDRLYPLEVIAKDGDRVKVHYIGYSSQYDEWRQSSELETLSPRSGQQLEPYQPFELHQELAYSIKLALVCSRKDPDVPTEMPFDLLLLTVG